MLDKMQNIRAVLEKAVELEIEGSGSALLDLKEVHSALLELNDINDELQDCQVDEGVACG